jgi:hypothetical protein
MVTRFGTLLDAGIVTFRLAWMDSICNMKSGKQMSIDCHTAYQASCLRLSRLDLLPTPSKRREPPDSGISIDKYEFDQRYYPHISRTPLLAPQTPLTLTHPISAAFSRNAWRLMLSPYLRIKPDFFFSPFTTLSLLVHAKNRWVWLTSCGYLCRKCVGGSSRRTRVTLWL